VEVTRRALRHPLAVTPLVGRCGDPRRRARRELHGLREGIRTVIHHPQGYGLGNAGQTASRTGTAIKAGESNYTEIGAETGLLGALLWIGWGLATFAALVWTERRIGWWATAGIASAFGAALVLAVQTDVIGDPWMGYCLWALAGVALTAAPILRE